MWCLSSSNDLLSKGFHEPSRSWSLVPFSVGVRPFPKTSTPNLGSTKPHIERVPGVVCLGVMRTGFESERSMSRLRMRGVTPPLLNMLWCCEQEHYYLLPLKVFDSVWKKKSVSLRISLWNKYSQFSCHYYPLLGIWKCFFKLLYITDKNPSCVIIINFSSRLANKYLLLLSISYPADFARAFFNDKFQLRNSPSE